MNIDFEDYYASGLSADDYLAEVLARPPATIGIDPGLSGALALVRPDGTPGVIFDLPVSAKAFGKGNQLDASTFAGVVSELGAKYRLSAVVERVGAMPKQGVTSVFGFGFTAGAIEGILCALKVPVTYVLPQAWKKHYGLLGKDKDASRTLCLQMFPQLQGELARKKDNGRSDALLIALYGAWKEGRAV